MTENAHRTHPPRRSILVRWDAAGNLGQLSTRDEHSGEVRSRFLLWTEDSRLHTVVDDRHHSYYAYDHAGERTLKVTGHSHQLDVNADLMHTAAGLDEFTLYPSPYLVFTNRGYTKHYYAGTERLAARLGGGFDRPVVGGDHGLSQLATALFEQCQKETEKRVLEAIPPHTIRRDHLSENIYMAMLREFEIPMHLMANAVIKSNNLLSTAQNIVSGSAEPEVYFYHSDHLGSASWITDATGTPVQHLQYLPYGEPYINQRAAGYSERFTFTGKERDEETGYSYFGARYMDHELMTMWLSVDPLSDKYPSISPYAYCAWNPIKLVDPDGREVVLPSNKKWAQKIVDDLNRIYKAVYHTESNAFVLQQGKDSKGNTYNRLGANEDFDWNQDKYTKAMKQCIDDLVKVEIKITKNNNPDGPYLSRGRKVNDFIQELGGGQTIGKKVYISEDLPTYSEENKTRGKFASKHCLGGIVLHELLYHCHTVGRTDEKESPLEGPKVMQSHYRLKRSRSHGTGDNQVFPSKQRR